MQRVTVTLDDDLMAELDRIIAARGYQNRSEAIRDLARAGIQQAAQETGAKGDCVAALVYVYDHAARELSKRLVRNFHGHHDMSLATLHDSTMARAGGPCSRGAREAAFRRSHHRRAGVRPAHRVIPSWSRSTTAAMAASACSIAMPDCVLSRCGGIAHWRASYRQPVPALVEAVCWLSPGHALGPQP
jgi:nickel-responsive transcriptional regulator NikR